jgi:fatty acid synthase subunit alpha
MAQRRQAPPRKNVAHFPDSFLRSFKDKVSYREVSVISDISVRDQLKHLVQVGSINFRQDECKGNPVVTYVKRHGTPQGLPTPLANGGYTFATTNAVFNALLTNEPYSNNSGDFNPIHINPYFSDLASLLDTITHGLWSSAATRQFVETVIARGHPDRVLA